MKVTASSAFAVSRKRQRGVVTVGAVTMVLAVLVWPVQAIIILVLLATVVALVDMYERWMHRHAFGMVQRRSLDRSVSAASFVFLAAGTVFAVLSPRSTISAAIGLGVLAFALWSATSAYVWLVAMKHDMAAPVRQTPEPRAWVRPRRPRPSAPIPTLPQPRRFSVRSHASDPTRSSTKTAA